MSKTFHFIGGLEDGIPVAICLEHDLVTQARIMDDLPEMCLDLLRAVVAASAEEGLDPWDRPPPPVDAITAMRSLPGCNKFTVVLEDDAS